MNSNDQSAMLQKAHLLLQNHQSEQAQALLEVLANLNNPQALYDLACVLLMQPKQTDAKELEVSLRVNLNRQFYENPEAQTIAQAMQYLHASEKLGYAPAAYRLATISLVDAAEPLDWQHLTQRMQFCCEQQHPNALCDAAIYFARYGTEAERIESTTLLEIAALKGSIVALSLLGVRLFKGDHCQQDRARANSIFEITHGLGMPTPEPDPKYGFSNAEPLNPPDTAMRFAFNNLAQCLELPEPIVVSPLSGLLRYENALSDEECLYIQCLAEGKLEPSIVVDYLGNSQLSKERTSHDFYFLPEHEQVYLNLLQARMSATAKLPLANSEQLTMLRYAPGQEFRTHRDNLPPNYFIAKNKGGSGQRHRTVIAYLAAPEQGGETEFPLLNLRVPANTGQILCFDNLLADGKLCRTSLHAGLPVIQGLKWICTLWMREQKHRSL